MIVGPLEMNLTILPDKALLDGHDLLKVRESTRFLACFGTPSRRREIPMHPSGIRVAMVWDELGLVAYEERPEGLMNHLFLAFDPKETPERPSCACQSSIEVNGGIVTSETLERTLPRKGSTPILTDFGKHFFCETGTYSAYFTFKRQPNPHSRHVITGRLITVSFIWR